MPIEVPSKKRAVKLPSKDRDVHEEVRTGALSPDDEVEYGMTIEVSLAPGQKAWPRFGVRSKVRDGETASQARERIVSYVDRHLDQIIEELAE